ncbi:ABC transporter ATP-binding protein [Natronolimnohabitans sp. A-GB9]|uniref:ABC transporter ATP-binding protein n=1 Tax=Natronolimnohabitans sp. A-GB9 TaxID=3069757 RepID=UPI0027AF2A71|nr:ABC transporter ATP-binding protein [Natronolimnohabitans sp. A-GB9]MDQ2051183.1 ABC transporter ATP-binding protein [Natronolimnohabitans sp. A-GB9]
MGEVAESVDSHVGGHEYTYTEHAAISVEDLVKEYGSGESKVRAVDGVTFDIEQSTAVGILGPNGAGKTTIIKSILSLVYPTSGTVRIHGRDVHHDQRAAHKRVGAMLEGARNTYWRLTVRENLEIFSVIGGLDYRSRKDRIDELLEQFNIAEKADTPVRELSRGQKQKVSLAATMVKEPQVIILDEPALGLDIESSLELRKELRRLVDQEGTTVLLCSHDMDVIQDVCERVIILNDGDIVADDTVDRLLDIFNLKVYEVTVDGSLSERDCQRLESELTVESFEHYHGQTTFRVQVPEDQFYCMVDSLKRLGVTVKSVESVEPDLEEVFLRITDQKGTEELPLAQQRNGGTL